MSEPPRGDRGWGRGIWGTSQWGSGITIPPAPPRIIPIAPEPDQTGVPQSRPITISFTDETQVAPSSLYIAVTGNTYVQGGVAINGATLEVEANAYNGFDVELKLPSRYPLGSRQEVVVAVQDVDGDRSDLVYYFRVGIGPRLLNVLNPMPGVLLAHFNEPMLQDEAFLTPGNWPVEGVSSDAVPLTITEVFAHANNAHTATLHYEGGGSTYELTVLNVISQDGDPLELGYNSAIFELRYGAEADPVIRLFDTIFGPVGISQREITRRTIDDHVVNRSLAIGMDQQFRLRYQSLDGTAGRDGRPGIKRT